jgi:hypothetical protein
LNHSGNTATQSIAQFFQGLEEETANGNMAALAERFSESFLAASPSGAKVAQRTVFAETMPSRKQAFDKLGCRSTRLVSVETTVLDARYTLARTRWQLTFARDGQGPQEVFADSTYIVDTGEEPFQIILYLTSQDLPKVLAECGIIPA